MDEGYLCTWKITALRLCGGQIRLLYRSPRWMQVNTWHRQQTICRRKNVVFCPQCENLLHIQRSKPIELISKLLQFLTSKKQFIFIFAQQRHLVLSYWSVATVTWPLSSKDGAGWWRQVEQLALCRYRANRIIGVLPFIPTSLMSKC